MNMVIMWLLLPVFLTMSICAYRYSYKKTKDYVDSMMWFFLVLFTYVGIFMACIMYNGQKLSQYHRVRAEAARHRCSHCGGER